MGDKRYVGLYKSNDFTNSEDTDFQLYKKNLWATAKITRVNLWDTLKVNQKYKAFQSIEKRSTTRQSRQEYSFRRFGKYFGQTVLDVGCDQGVIKEFFEHEYVGVDYCGDPDVKIDLEKEKLCFPSDKFDAVLCIEVLEHLDNLHAVFNELVRVSQSTIIVTLPNCWRQVLGDIILGRSNKSEYGLPNERPMDRHKWFFNTEEAESFIAYQCWKNKLKIIEMEYVYNMGDIFSFSYYPPQRPMDEQSYFYKILIFGTIALERAIKCLLCLFRGKVRKNIEIVNIWFVLQK